MYYKYIKNQIYRQISEQKKSDQKFQAHKRQPLFKVERE